MPHPEIHHPGSLLSKLLTMCIAVLWLASSDFTVGSFTSAQAANGIVASHFSTAGGAKNDERRENVIRVGAQTVFQIQRKIDKIKLNGPAPTEDDKKILLGMIEANFPGVTIQDRSEINKGQSQNDAWLSGVSFILRQLALMKTGSGQIYDNHLSLSGIATNAENYKLVQKSLLSELPAGLVLDAMSVKPPDADYILLMQYQEGSVIITGRMPDEQNQKALTNLAEFLFPEANVENNAQITEGAPENWASAAFVSLKALRYLQSGSVSISDQIVKVDGVPGGDDIATYFQALNQSMPFGFVIENETIGAERMLFNPASVR